MSLESGNAMNLRAHFLPISLMPTESLSGTDELSDNLESSLTGGNGDVGDGGDDGQSGEGNDHVKSGYYTFPGTSNVERAVIVHASNPSIKCGVRGQDKNGEEVNIVFSTNTPLQQPVFGVSSVICFGR